MPLTESNRYGIRTRLTVLAVLVSLAAHGSSPAYPRASVTPPAAPPQWVLRSADRAMLLLMSRPSWYRAQASAAGEILTVLDQMSRFDSRVLRELMRRVQIRCSFPNEDPLLLTDNAALLNRYLFRVPRTVPVQGYESPGPSVWPLPIFSFAPPSRSAEVALADALYPLVPEPSGRLVLDLTSQPRSGRSAVGYPILEEFEYLRRYCGVRRRPGWDEGAAPASKLPRLIAPMTHEIGSPEWQPPARHVTPVKAPRPGSADAAMESLVKTPSWVWAFRDERLNQEITSTLTRLSRYPLGVLREVMRRVDARSAYPNVDPADVVDNAVLLNRYLFRVPSRLNVSRSRRQDGNRAPMRTYLTRTSSGSTVPSPLFPLQLERGERLILPRELPGTPVGSHGFSVLGEFDYLKKRFGVRHRTAGP
jgi:hypothetical protein